MKTIATEGTIYPQHIAEGKALLLNAGDDEWTYRVEPIEDRPGYARIAIYEENGFFIAHASL